MTKQIEFRMDGTRNRVFDYVVGKGLTSVSVYDETQRLVRVCEYSNGKIVKFGDETTDFLFGKEAKIPKFSIAAAVAPWYFRCGGLEAGK